MTSLSSLHRDGDVEDSEAFFTKANLETALKLIHNAVGTG